jgi:uncharacterized repeat protein (TIGR01451 family)
MIRHWYLWFIFLAVVIWLSPGSTIGRSSSTIVDQSGRTLIFDDEFDGSTLNTAVWDTCIPWWDPNNCTIEDNSELELYLPENAYLDGNGHLMLKAEKKHLGGRNYVSGMVDSYNSFSFQYGYAEARLKVPAGNGFWPAFWMLPPNDGPWPIDEIDIMENLGYDPTTAFFSYHWPADGSTQLVQHHITGPDFSADWHTFAVDWEPSAIIWYVDGVERARYTEASNITSKPMFVILQLAIGGVDSWPGPPDDTTPFPSYFQVDYVRVWQQSPPDSLSLSKSVFPSSLITPGSPITYTISFQNNTSVTSAGVLITDVIPSYLHDIAYLSDGVTITSTGSISYTWLVEDLAPSSGGVITVTGIVNTGLPAGSVFTNTATITSTTPETNTNDNTGWAILTIVNAPPMAVDDNAHTFEDTPVIVAVLDNDSDPNGDELALSGIQPPLHGSATISGTAILYTPSMDFNGTDGFEYTLTDGILTSTASVLVTILPVNDPPLADAGPDQSANEGEFLHFNGIVTDVDDATFDISWDFGDGSVLIGTLTPTHTFLNDGIYTVTLTTSDDEGGIGRDVLLVTVANVTPTLNGLNDMTATAGLPVKIELAFSDPGLLDLHTVTILWPDNISYALELTADKFALSVSRVIFKPGTYTVSVSVTDDFGSGNSGQFRLIVVPASYKIYLPVAFW